MAIKDGDYVRILGWRDSILRLEETVGKFERGLMEFAGEAFLPFVSFFLLLSAQFKALESLNDEYLNCGLAWDERTGLPSHPSIIADGQTYRRLFKPDGILDAVLASFSGWILLSREQLFCCCGKKFRGPLKDRNVEIDVLLNHILSFDDEKGFVVKQLVGIKCGDPEHLEHHYDFKKQSRRDDGLYIIWLCENRLIVNGKVEAALFSKEQAGQFNAPELYKRLNGLPLVAKSLPLIS